MERGDDTASASVHLDVLYRVCYDPPPMNTPVREGETIDGSRTMRNRPYQVLKCSLLREAGALGVQSVTSHVTSSHSRAGELEHLSTG